MSEHRPMAAGDEGHGTLSAGPVWLDQPAITGTGTLTANIIDATPKPLDITIAGSRDQVFLHIRELPDGRLDVEGDPADFTEAAEVFLTALTDVAAGRDWTQRR